MRKLDIVGTGLVYPDHLTEVAASLIENCDFVLALLDEKSRLEELRSRNPNLENLNVLYSIDKDRLQTYEEMAQRVVDATQREHDHVVLVAYGNPGFLCRPVSNVLERLQNQDSVEVQVHSGISALDCLMADLAVDAEVGFEAYEVNNLLIFDQEWDPKKGIVLWQIGILGEFSGAALLAGEGMQVASEELSRIYGPDQEVAVYVASVVHDEEPDIIYTSCHGLRDVRPYSLATLYIPPKGERVHRPVPRVDAQLELVGLGYRPSKDSTRQSLKLIREAGSVFYHSLTDTQQEFLRGVRDDVQEFTESDAFRDAQSGSVIVVYPDHPSFCGGSKLVRRAKESGLRARIEASTSFLSEVVLFPEADFDTGHQWFAHGSGNQWCPGVSFEPLTEELAKHFHTYSLKLGETLEIQPDGTEPPFLLMPLEGPPQNNRARLRLESLAATSLAIYHLRSLPSEMLTLCRLHCIGKSEPPEILQAVVDFSFAELGNLTNKLGLDGNQEAMAYYCENPNSTLAHLVKLASNCQRAQQALSDGIPQERVREILDAFPD